MSQEENDIKELFNTVFAKESLVPPAGAWNEMNAMLDAQQAGATIAWWRWLKLRSGLLIAALVLLFANTNTPEKHYERRAVAQFEFGLDTSTPESQVAPPNVVSANTASLAANVSLPAAVGANADAAEQPIVAPEILQKQSKIQNSAISRLTTNDEVDDDASTPDTELSEYRTERTRYSAAQSPSESISIPDATVGAYQKLDVSTVEPREDVGIMRTMGLDINSEKELIKIEDTESMPYDQNRHKLYLLAHLGQVSLGGKSVPRISQQVGLGIEFFVKPHFTLSAEMVGEMRLINKNITISDKYYGYGRTDVEHNYRVTSTMYGTLPAFAGYRYGRIEVKAGGYLGYLYTSRIIVDRTTEGFSSQNAESNTLYGRLSQFNSLDLGLCADFSLLISERGSLGLRYYHGLSDIVNEQQHRGVFAGFKLKLK